MLTILAWMTFIPAAVWNVVFFSIAFSETLTQVFLCGKLIKTFSMPSQAWLCLLSLVSISLVFFKGYDYDETGTNHSYRTITYIQAI